jgi:hypothetical protein
MRAQMRRMAALRSVNFRTGVTPGRLLKRGRRGGLAQGNWLLSMSGNAWPELITVGTVMRPMVPDMGFEAKTAMHPLCARATQGARCL